MAPQTTDAELSAMDRLRGALGDYVSAKIGSAAGKVGERITDTTKRLGEFATKGGDGDSSKSSSESNGPDSEGNGAVKPSDTKVTSVIEVLDVGVPLRTAYDHWTQYEAFSGFAKGVNSVSKDDDTTSTWTTKIAFSSRSFESTVQEQIPDDRIVWTSTGSKGTTQGAVSFHELTPTLTRIVLVLEYQPSGFFEKTGNLWRAQGRRIRLDFKHFQRYVTLAGEEPEGWRGEIRDGEVVRTDEDARADEEAEGTDDADTDDDADDADESDESDEADEAKEGDEGEEGEEET